MDSHARVQIELNYIDFFVSIRDGEQKIHRKFMFQWSCRSLMFFLLKGMLWDRPCPADWEFTSNGKIKCGMLWEDVFLKKNEWLSFLYVYQKLESHEFVKTFFPTSVMFWDKIWNLRHLIANMASAFSKSTFPATRTELFVGQRYQFLKLFGGTHKVWL